MSRARRGGEGGSGSTRDSVRYRRHVEVMRHPPQPQQRHVHHTAASVPFDLQSAEVLPIHTTGEGTKVPYRWQGPDRRLPGAHPVQVVELRLDVDHGRALRAGDANDVGDAGEHGAVAVAEERPREVALLHVVLGRGRDVQQ